MEEDITNLADLELNELIESCWIALRAEEIADEKFNPQTEPDKHWQAFEIAHTDAGFEWIAFYSGHTYGEVEPDEMLEKAIKVAKSQRNWESEQVQFFSKPKTKPVNEQPFEENLLSPEDPICTGDAETLKVRKPTKSKNTPARNSIGEKSSTEIAEKAPAAFDPNAEETEEDAIRAELIRREKVRRLTKKK